MIELLRYMKSDLYKLRRSAFFWLHILFPICGVALVLLYASFAEVSSISKIATFFQLFAIAYPFVISVICTVVAEQEIKAGYCQNILVLPSRTKVMLSKFLVMAACGLLSVGLGTALFAGIFPLTDADLNISYMSYIIPALVLWGSNLLLYTLHLLGAFYFGRNVCIGVGAVGSLLAALLQTGLGTGLWFVLPYGFGVRLTDYFLMYSMDVISVLNTEIKFGMGCCIGITSVAICLMITFLYRYSGKSVTD